MEREYTKRRGQKLSKAETAALNIEVLKDLNHVDMAGRPIDNQAFNSWMSRKRHEGRQTAVLGILNFTYNMNAISCTLRAGA